MPGEGMLHLRFDRRIIAAIKFEDYSLLNNKHAFTFEVLNPKTFNPYLYS